MIDEGGTCTLFCVSSGWPFRPGHSRRFAEFHTGFQMILQLGFQSIEFQHKLELPKPLNFDSFDAALTWLKHLAHQHTGVIAQCRQYVTYYSEDPGSFRLTE